MDKINITPHDSEIECSVLGTIINYPDSIFKVMDIIDEGAFYDYDNKTIYLIMLEMMHENIKTDLVSLYNKLKTKEKLTETLTSVYLSNLMDSSYTIVYLVQHCQILKELQIRRELIVNSNNISSLCYNLAEPLDEIIDYTQRSVFESTTDTLKSEPESLSVITEKVCTDIEQRQTSLEKSGVPSGFNQLRWNNSDLIIAAARPAMGKTYIGAVKWALEAARYNVPVLIFSLEMSKEQLGQRFISLQSEIDSNLLRNASKTINWEDLENARKYCSSLPIYIDDNAGMTIWQLQAKARKMKILKNIGLIIIDYIGLINGITKQTTNRNDELGVITRILKKIAKDLDVPVIALSQLNRGVEQRREKRPVMSDLRESGNIEQDADVILMFYRDFYYSKEVSTAGQGEIITTKNRHGSLGTTKFYHNSTWSKIEPNEFMQDLSLFKPVEDDLFAAIKNEFE